MAKVRRGRMDRTEMAELIREGDFAAVVDATHPYAEAATENIRAAMEGMEIPYFRLKRNTKEAEEPGGRIRYFDTARTCAQALAETEGNILLTTGSRELKDFCALEEKERLYVRILPEADNLLLCRDLGIRGKQILALQGPFTEEMNEAMIRQYQIRYLVTKASGRTGGYQAKLEAAERTGIPVFVIGDHGEDPGYSFREVCRKLEDLCGKKLEPRERMEIVLAGVGMGSADNLTREVYQAIESADILLGARRMIERYRPGMEKKPYYKAEQVIPYLKELQESLVLEGGNVVVLFSGDSGFYSGCQSLYEALRAEIKEGGLRASVRIMPGISSVAYLAACIGEKYQDAAILSMHGKAVPNLAERVRGQAKAFVLTSGAEDVCLLGRTLLEAGMEGCEIHVGYQLSYPEQRIWALTAEECCAVREEGLYTCFIRNPYAGRKRLTHGRADGEFIRDRIPMTKEEVREVSICKLKLHKDAVVYDIGSGTGSVAVEIAGLCGGIQVYAIERKDEAVRLIQKNKEKFLLDNITVVAAEAPDGFDGLPVPSRAFIGGSGGRLAEILSALYGLNPRMRIVVNAVSLETVCEIKELMARYPTENGEIVQIQVSRAREAGEHHLMLAENPVWICAFDFCPEREGIGRNET